MFCFKYLKLALTLKLTFCRLTFFTEKHKIGFAFEIKMSRCFVKNDIITKKYFYLDNFILKHIKRIFAFMLNSFGEQFYCFNIKLKTRQTI